ncbi:MAG TPA: hypothetical protein VID95_13765 [Candidatus Limnocylindrales bacterium]
MFPSQPLMHAIHSDRMREIERASREHRMLETPAIETAPTMRIATAAPVRRADVTTGTGRSSDAACGVA